MGARCVEEASRLVGLDIRYQDAEGFCLMEHLHPARVIAGDVRLHAVVSEHARDELCLDARRDGRNH